MSTPVDPEDPGDVLYVDGAGRIYLGDDIAAGGVLASGWTSWLERDLLWRRHRASPELLCAFTTTAKLGERLAEVVDAAPFIEASDACQRVWLAEQAEVHEREELLDFWPAGTVVSSVRPDDIATALFALAAFDSSAPVRWSPPRGKPLAVAHAEVALRLPRLEEQTDRVRGELWVTGSPGSWAIVAR